MLSPPKRAKAAQLGRGGLAETIEERKQEPSTASRPDVQARRDWLYRTLHWQLALAKRIGEADSRVVTACSRAEVDAIAAEVRAFKVHVERGGAV